MATARWRSVRASSLAASARVRAASASLRAISADWTASSSSRLLCASRCVAALEVALGGAHALALALGQGLGDAGALELAAGLGGLRLGLLLGAADQHQHDRGGDDDRAQRGDDAGDDGAPAPRRARGLGGHGAQEGALHVGDVAAEVGQEAARVVGRLAAP